MKQPMCYVISHATSRVVADCRQSLQTHGWKFKNFTAVDGTKITTKDWEHINVQMSPTAGKLPHRPGAQGCWFSHWALWNLCVESGQPLIILEHDAVIQASWPQDLDIDTCIVRLYQYAHCKEKVGLGIWAKGAHAYSITPYQAKQLIDRARHWGGSPVDKHIISGSIPWRFLGWDLVTLNPLRGRSSTSRQR